MKCIIRNMGRLMAAAALLTLVTSAMFAEDMLSSPKAESQVLLFPLARMDRIELFDSQTEAIRAVLSARSDERVVPALSEGSVRYRQYGQSCGNELHVISSEFDLVRYWNVCGPLVERDRHVSIGDPLGRVPENSNVIVIYCSGETFGGVPDATIMSQSFTFRAYPGREVLSAGDGAVLATGRDDQHGLFAVVDHEGIVVEYRHLSAVFVTRGQTVQLGELIGTVGSTGRTRESILSVGLSEYDESVGDILIFVAP